jgi:putative ABC transport system permease protein
MLARYLSGFTPFPLNPVITMASLGVSALMATVGSFVVVLPFVMKIYDINASRLFSEEPMAVVGGPKRLWAYVPGVVVLSVLAVYQAHSWKIGGSFAVAILGVTLLLVALGAGTLRLGRYLRVSRPWFYKYSLLSLSRRSGASLAVFVALGLGALLINILPQLKHSLQLEFKIQGRSKVPSLFMFDIQDEQRLAVESLFQRHQVVTLAWSPLIRARILKVNGQDFERKIEAQTFKTREEEREARFRNRGVNLSYRTNLSTTEALEDGRPFSGVFNASQQQRPELSLEYRFAERIGVKLGDVLRLDIQGVEIEGQVVNTRRVRWTSFQPNFFVLVQPGVLDDAPKTHIVALPSLGSEARLQIQKDMATEFSNVSIIDVVKTVDQVLETAEKMSWSLALMAALALLSGYIVLFSIIRSQMTLRRWELNMLKVLGASGREIIGFILIEFTALAFLASFVGALMSMVVSWGLNIYIFGSQFEGTWGPPLQSVIVITVLSGILCLLTTSKVIRESSLVLLREQKS